LSLSALLSASNLHAQSSDRSLEQIEAEAQAALAEEARIARERAEVERAIEALKTQMSSVSATATALESQVSEIGTRVETLNTDLQTLTAQITTDRTTLTRLVAALQRIEANPPPPIAAGGESAIATARAAALTSTVAGNVKSRSDQLAANLIELQNVRTQLDTERTALQSRQESLTAQRKELSRLAKEKITLSAKLGTEQAAQARLATELAEEAETLRELIASLEAAAKAEPRVKPRGDLRGLSELEVRPRIKPPVGGYAPRPLPEGLRFADARGQLGLPVLGQIAKTFTSDHKGLSVLTDRGAQVISPYGGRIEFAGPFKNYERLVILNAGDGYFVVLTGLGETFVGAGEDVRTGEPLGEMPRQSTDPELYIEFRKDGRTIDPGPWMM
jgi:septal ring factor EnvC (AmiA/AmiB activator)